MACSKLGDFRQYANSGISTFIRRVDTAKTRNFINHSILFQMKQFILPILLTLVFVLGACKKEEAETIPFSGTISIVSPNENDTIVSSPSFLLSIQASANKEMHGYSIQLFNANTDDLLYEDLQHVHNTSYTILSDVAISVADTIPVRLVVETAGDHEDEKLQKTRGFVIIP
jgi:hypothetical protein